MFTSPAVPPRVIVPFILIYELPSAATIEASGEPVVATWKLASSVTAPEIGASVVCTLAL